MNIFFVSLFGHREINDLWQLENKLFPILKNLIRAKQFVTFFVGRHGEFDEYSASLVKRAQKELGSENSCLTLVLPYTLAGLEYYEKYYDEVIIPIDTHPKYAITLKNRWAVEQSDLVITFVERKTGGAYEAMKYAES